jgi:hypothetical protein
MTSISGMLLKTQVIISDTHSAVALRYKMVLTMLRIGRGKLTHKFITS